MADNQKGHLGRPDVDDDLYLEPSSSRCMFSRRLGHGDATPALKVQIAVLM